MSRIFTAFESPGSNRRLKLTLSAYDWALVDRGYRWGPHQFMDLETGTVVEAQGADCGAGRCFCAAEIVRIVSEGTKPLVAFD